MAKRDFLRKNGTLESTNAQRARARRDFARARGENTRARGENTRAREQNARAREQNTRAREQNTRAREQNTRAREQNTRARQENTRAPDPSIMSYRRPVTQAAFLAEAIKWCIILAIAIWLTFAQIAAWWRGKKKGLRTEC